MSGPNALGPHTPKWHVDWKHFGAGKVRITDDMIEEAPVRPGEGFHVKSQVQLVKVQLNSVENARTKRFFGLFEPRPDHPINPQ